VVRYNADKKAKRRVIGAALHKEGFEGYFMALDADDWLHRRAAEFFVSSLDRKTKVLNAGFVVNLLHESASLRRRGFYYGCGSSAVFYFQHDDFPSNDTPEESEPLRFQLALQSHQRILENLARKGEPVQLIDIPLLAWVLGTGQNLSLQKGKKQIDHTYGHAEPIPRVFYERFCIRALGKPHWAAGAIAFTRNLTRSFWRLLNHRSDIVRGRSKQH
jgi:hypothetical protein